jgi:hypothetical protein
MSLIASLDLAIGRISERGPVGARQPARRGAALAAASGAAFAFSSRC